MKRLKQFFLSFMAAMGLVAIAFTCVNAISLSKSFTVALNSENIKTTDTAYYSGGNSWSFSGPGAVRQSPYNYNVSNVWATCYSSNTYHGSDGYDHAYRSYVVTSRLTSGTESYGYGSLSWKGSASLQGITFDESE